MKTLLAAGLWVMSIAAIADTTTFICTDAHGKKSLQDRPCQATAISSEARQTKSNAAPAYQGKSFESQMDDIRCNSYRRDLEHNRARSNEFGSNADKAIYRDRMISAQEKIKRECQ